MKPEGEIIVLAALLFLLVLLGGCGAGRPEVQPETAVVCGSSQETVVMLDSTSDPCKALGCEAMRFDDDATVLCECLRRCVIGQLNSIEGRLAWAQGRVQFWSGVRAATDNDPYLMR